MAKSRITILSMLEEGYGCTFEHLAFRQLKGAYKCNLITVPFNFLTIEEALAEAQGELIFMLPPHRLSKSTEFADFVFPETGDVTFVFGSPQETLVKRVGENRALHITTPGKADMMAVCVAAQVMYVHG